MCRMDRSKKISKEGGGLWLASQVQEKLIETSKGIISRFREVVGNEEDFSKGKKEEWLINGSDSNS